MVHAYIHFFSHTGSLINLFVDKKRKLKDISLLARSLTHKQIIIMIRGMERQR